MPVAADGFSEVGIDFYYFVLLIFYSWMLYILLFVWIMYNGIYPWENWLNTCPKCISWVPFNALSCEAEENSFVLNEYLGRQFTAWPKVSPDTFCGNPFPCEVLSLLESNQYSVAKIFQLVKIAIRAVLFEVEFLFVTLWLVKCNDPRGAQSEWCYMER